MLLALIWTCCSRCSPPTPPVFLSCPSVCLGAEEECGCAWLGLPTAALSLQPGWHVLGLQLKSPPSVGQSSAMWGLSHILPVSLLGEGSFFPSWLPGWLSPSLELHGKLPAEAGGIWGTSGTLLMGRWDTRCLPGLECRRNSCPWGSWHGQL